MKDFIGSHVVCAELIKIRLSCLNGFTLLWGLRSPANTGIEWLYAWCRSLALGCWFINILISVSQAQCLLSAPPPVCTWVLMAVSLTRSCSWFTAAGPQLMSKCSNYKNSNSWYRKFRIDFCYHCSINSRFVSGTGHPSPAPTGNLCTAMFNKPSVNQKLVIQGLFAFSFPCNEVFD